MAVSTLSEVVGKLIGGKCIRFCKAVYRDPEILWAKVRRNMDDWMKNWDDKKLK